MSSIIPTLTDPEAEYAIQSLCRLITFETVSNTATSTGAYVAAASYLLEQLATVPCFDEIHILPNSPPDSPVVVARWKGIDEHLPVILLNSHYDVVPASPTDWTVSPFGGIRSQGRIYGRGTQDMKSVCIQYIEAIRTLTRMTNNTPQRSIYLSFVPDEEVGGGGMTTFLSSDLFASLPGIALALDEGLASPTSTYSIFYGERLPWWVHVEATGATGHGSRFIEPTAVAQILHVANKALSFRDEQRAILFGSLDKAQHLNCSHAVVAAANHHRQQATTTTTTKTTLGDVTSLNITTLQAGVRSGKDYVYNVVPPTASMSLDIRISPHVSPSFIGALLDTWCQECATPATTTPLIDSSTVEEPIQNISTTSNRSVTWRYIGNHGNDLQQHALTSMDATINPWYERFTLALEQMGLEYTPQVFPAATDSRFLRAMEIHALGFSPMRNSPILLHENDEYIDEAVFVEGIGVYVGLLNHLLKY